MNIVEDIKNGNLETLEHFEKDLKKALPVWVLPVSEGDIRKDRDNNLHVLRRGEFIPLGINITEVSKEIHSAGLGRCAVYGVEKESQIKWLWLFHPFRTKKRLEEKVGVFFGQAKKAVANFHGQVSLNSELSEGRKHLVTTCKRYRELLKKNGIEVSNLDS